MINCFLHRRILGRKKCTTFKNCVLFYNCTNQISVLFVITLVIYVITWENNESKLHSKWTWISIFSPFLQLLCSINLSCRSKSITQTLWGGGRGPSLTYLGRFNDFLSRRYWCFAVLEVRVKPILLLHFCCLILFFAYEKGSRWSIFEACWNSIPPLHLSLLSGSAMGNFFLKKKKKKTTRIFFIPSEKKKKARLVWG